MSELTGLWDTDRLVMLHLRPNDLLSIVQVSKYFHGLLDDSFWRQRIRRRFRASCVGENPKSIYLKMFRYGFEPHQICKAAVIYNEIAILRKWLGRGDRDKNLRVAFGAAAANNNRLVIEMLYNDLFSDLNNNERVDEMHHAIIYNYKALIDYLLSRHQYSVAQLSLMAGSAAAAGSIDVIRQLVKKGADISLRRYYPLLMAVLTQREEVVRYLTTNNDDTVRVDNVNLCALPVVINGQIVGYTSVLRCAVVEANLSIVKLLLEAGGDANEVNLLNEALTRTNIDVAKLLVEYGSSVSSIADYMLNASAERGLLEHIHFFYEKITERFRVANFPLEGPVLLGRTRVVKLLLSKLSYSLSALERALRIAREHNYRFLVALLEKEIAKRHR